jgi:hypothetical protein
MPARQASGITEDPEKESRKNEDKDDQDCH